jgi:two-component system sensor histidine kinase PilS (NtrC family)
VIFQDMTEILSMRRAVADSERMAALGRVAAGLAHEIRNPLGAISGSVEMLRSASALGSEDRDLLGLVLDETRRLNDLVGDILHFARPRPPQQVRVDLAALVRDVATIFRRGSASHGAAVEVEGPAALETSVDPHQIRQVLWNLLKNAAAATTGAAPVRIRVSPHGPGASIEVVDEGPGIAPEDRQRIFDPFHSGNEAGIGIGLALVRQIVEAHGGAIEVDSSPRGTTMRVVLP